MTEIFQDIMKSITYNGRRVSEVARRGAEGDGDEQFGWSEAEPDTHLLCDVLGATEIVDLKSVFDQNHICPYADQPNRFSNSLLYFVSICFGVIRM